MKPDPPVTSTLLMVFSVPPAVSEPAMIQFRSNVHSSRFRKIFRRMGRLLVGDGGPNGFGDVHQGGVGKRFGGTGQAGRKTEGKAVDRFRGQVLHDAASLPRPK